MSIEVDWGTATSGPDGEALAERIRSFIHDKFQQVALPRFIRSVQVHSFDFGTIPPELEIKDFCEPFADFYEEDEDDEASDVSEELVSGHGTQWHRTGSELSEPPFRDENAMHQPLRNPFDERFQPSALRSPIALGDHLNPHFLPRAGTPGIPGGTSTLGYHLMSLGGLSGTQTPLAAVAGGNPFANSWNDPSSMGARSRGPLSSSPFDAVHSQHPEADLDSSNPTSRPSTSSTLPSHPGGSSNGGGEAGAAAGGSSSHMARTQENGHLGDSASAEPLRLPRLRERRPEDLQVLCHVKYGGDVRLSLTAEILLDYPMPSFVGLPLKLNVTGITFDGVAVIAHIRKRVHFCFLSPEDADALIGSDQQDAAGGQEDKPRAEQTKRHGGLLEEIRVESEIGRKEDGKQVLKNVGKVERFVLAQVRRIFEEEFVYPSFWTFLV
ncbi:ERMES complex subunit MDM12 [Aspergillus brunneoviolaceus CBS 621.78]|uniref:Mitochondrial distribution and morphology protein 12 n=2 Tax=Aspergillus TaxID=5052 RepID=A0A8G1RDC0_9EURO|nr:mitochondrial distribution and morphology protein 12 [Aspergillus brunneoviolaceus CBS 621.78]XP_040794856.1 mitochondrial distribution and morphology protein 12 [Aspergillus fijiensis CBS 313.89]RAH50253.1 mitochondrial distribution and morphology protein 12 [Aspergillus brunneoviolaceus CBS 621.78]RAK70844.1 mitochondrial distribution and morphology protein 12 [Aspergillus fijiensis CBS 313.89]